MDCILKRLACFATLLVGLASFNGHAGQIVRVSDPCENVIARSEKEPTPDQSLSLLGSCLATPAPLDVLQRVALQMAIVSFRKGDSEWGMRYLIILRQMLAPDEGDKGVAKG